MPATRRNLVILLVAVATPSLVLAACGSGSSSPTTVATHAPGVPYLTTSGTGNRTIQSVDLPTRWSVVWKFSCTDPTTRRPFRVAVSSGGRPATTVTDQTGLAGGGFHPFSRGGPTTFTVTTSCTWSLLVGTVDTQAFPATTRTSTP